MINYTFIISNANFDLNYAVISLPGADSKGRTGSSMELVPVPTHLLTSKSRFQLQKIWNRTTLKFLPFCWISPPRKHYFENLLVRFPTCGILIFAFSGGHSIYLPLQREILNCIQTLTWVRSWSGVSHKLMLRLSLLSSVN